MTTEIYSSGDNSSWWVRNRDTPAPPNRGGCTHENQLQMVTSMQDNGCFTIFVKETEGRRLLYMRCPQGCNLGQSSYFDCTGSICSIQLRHLGRRQPATALVMLLEGTGLRAPCSHWPGSSPFRSCAEKQLHPNLLPAPLQGAWPRERLCVARVFLCLSSPTWPEQPLQAVSSQCKIEHPSSCALPCQLLSSCSLAQSWRSTDLSGSHHCRSPRSLSPAPGRLSPPRDTLAMSGRPRPIWGRWQQRGRKQKMIKGLRLTDGESEELKTSSLPGGDRSPQAASTLGSKSRA